MQRTNVFAAALATSMLLASATGSYAQQTPPPEAVDEVEDDDEGFDLGWLGLLGLAGLMGLQGRKRDHVHPVTTTNRM